MTEVSGAGVTEYRTLFDLAPVSLWLEDYSGIQAAFEALRQEGITDLRTHLHAHRELVGSISAQIKVIEVNRRTLDLFGARDLPHLLDNLHLVFRDDMFDQHVEELGQMWDGASRFSSQTVNYALDGTRLDILLKGRFLPGHEHDWQRVLVSIEDISARVQAERELERAERYSRGLFEHSPVSLWVEDFSGVKSLLDQVREGGIRDFRTFLNVHADFIARCMEEIRVLDVNQQTLKMFAAPDKATLIGRLSEVFRDDMRTHFSEQLIDIWNGKLFQQREAVNYALNGETVNVYMQWSVIPGHEDDLALVLVSLTDITARKKAEAYLEFLGNHDALTKLRNRAYYDDELARLQRGGPWPVSILSVDLNGLKTANDNLGHAAGDSLLRRAGEVLKKAVHEPHCVARIGGDEFAVLLPAHDERKARTVVEQINEILDLNNQFYPGARLSFAIGAATSRPGETLEETAKRADQSMYGAKRAHYQSAG